MAETSNENIWLKWKLELTDTRVKKCYSSSACRTEYEVDMTPWQPEGMNINIANERVSQRQQCDLMGAGKKGDCFVFDLFKNRISQLKKEISKKDEIISFLTGQLSVKNVVTVPSNSLQNQSQERSTNSNPLNDSIESEILSEEEH